jgi:hypothetical protein
VPINLDRAEQIGEENKTPAPKSDLLFSQIEGAVWRIENRGKFDFMVKYVRPNKVDGLYLEVMKGETYWNWKEKVV